MRSGGVHVLLESGVARGGEAGGNAAPDKSGSKLADQSHVDQGVGGELVAAGEPVDEEVRLATARHLDPARCDRAQDGPRPVASLKG